MVSSLRFMLFSPDSVNTIRGIFPFVINPRHFSPFYYGVFTMGVDVLNNSCIV